MIKELEKKEIKNKTKEKLKKLCTLSEVKPGILKYSNLLHILTQNAKIIKCKGYHKKYNPQKDYKQAKQPIGKINEIEIKNFDEAKRWIEEEGWIGLLLHQISVIDVDKDKYKINLLKWYMNKIFKNKKTRPIQQKTKNGYHFLFKLYKNNDKPFNNSNYLSSLGVELTIKSAENSYIIIEPSEEKKWLTEPNLNNLPDIPDVFKPLNFHDKKEIINAIIINMAFCYHRKIINGYEDIELSFTYFLLKESYNDEFIHNSFKFIFPDYNNSRTNLIIERTKKRIKNGEEVKGIKSLLETIENKNLKYLKKLFELYFKAKNNSSNANDIVILEENKPEINTFSKIEPFPIWTLPDVFQYVASQVGKAFNRNHEIPAVTLLWTIGGVIGRTRKVYYKQDFMVYPNLYIALVAPSGMRKSPIIRFFWDILKAKDYELYMEYQEKLKQYEKESLVYEKKIKELKRKRGEISEEDIPDKPEKPKEDGFIVDDFTIEKLISMFQANKRGLITYQDELRGFYARIGKYSKKDTSENTKSYFDKMYDGETIKYTRKNSETIYIPEPILSIYGCITPSALEATFTNLDFVSGHLQRWLFYSHWDDSLDAFGVNDFTVTDEAKNFIMLYYDYLISLNFEINTEGRIYPKLIGLKEDAKDLFKEFTIEINKMKKVSEIIHKDFGGFISKTDARTLKIALILHTMESFVSGEEKLFISKNTLEKAIVITKWFVEHTKQIWRFIIEKNKPLILNSPILNKVAQSIVDIYDMDKMKYFTIDYIKNYLETKYDLDLSNIAIGRILSQLGLEESNPTKINKKSTRVRRVNSEIINQIKTKILNVESVVNETFNDKEFYSTDGYRYSTDRNFNQSGENIELSQTLQKLQKIYNSKLKNKKDIEKDSIQEIMIDEDKLDIFKIQPLDDIPDYQPETEPIPYNELKKFYFDIETTGLKPDKSTLIAIGVMDDEGNVKIFKGKENKILSEFNAYILKEKPDILIGHNVFDFDIPYIIKKLEQYKIKPIFELIKKNKVIGNTSWNGQPITINLYKFITKKVDIIDTFILTAKFDYSARKLKSYSLKNAVIQLGLRNNRRLKLSATEINKLFQEGNLQTIEKYLKYDLEDTKLLADLFIPQYYYQLELFKPETKINLQNLCLIGEATKWNIILSQYYNKIPQPEEKKKYKGGLTIANKGLYKNCAKIDVASLYPSIMLTYRIYSKKDSNKTLLSILKYLREQRLKFKKLAKKGDKDADYRQAAMKILINSAYGFLGTTGINFNDYEAAALVTAYGRKILKLMLDEIEKAGGIICEADTDGIIYSADDNHQIYEIVKSKLPQNIDIDFEWEVKASLILSKKNYLILTKDGEVKPKGKIRRRDRIKLEKQFYENYFKFFVESPEKAEAYYQDMKERIKNRTINKELLVYERVIRKGEKKLVEAGIGKVGDRVKYYIGSNNQPVKSGDYCIEYYLKEIEKMKNEIDKTIKNNGRQYEITNN